MTRNITEEGAHPVDRHVGRRVVERRVALGHTQSDLARALGISFQQIQKYEKGDNRISASRLWDIAAFLKVDIAFFYDELADDGFAEPDVTFEPEPTPTRTTLEISRLARRLSFPQQKLALDMMTALAGADGPRRPGAPRG